MFNVERIIKPSILKVVLPIGAINKALVFIKSKNMLSFGLTLCSGLFD
jgi:hypothetical protein